MAARVYFDKQAPELTLPEAALLAGLPASPGAYDPAANPEAATSRRTTVLRLMLEQGLITPSDYRTADESPLPTAAEIGLPGSKGRVGYFAEYVKQQLVPYYGSGEVFGGGLEIYTSIDLELQDMARDGDRPLAHGLARPRGRARRDRPARRPGPGHGRRRELPQEPVQPGRAGPAPDGLGVQAVRAHDGGRAGHRAADRLHLGADRDQPRRQALVGQQLRGLVPRADRPPGGDDPLGQHGLRAADGAGRAREGRRHGAQARRHPAARRLLRDRPRRRGREPARDGPRVRHARQRRPARRRLRARQRPARRAQGRGRRESRRQRPAREEGGRRERRRHRQLDPPARGQRGHGEARRARRPAGGRARPGRPRTTATRGSSATRRSSRSPCGSATRIGSSRWRPSSTATPWRAARSRR